ncbi:MAG: alpha-amylase family glycosyl hydrolase [Bacteroidota bacterium]
MSLRCTFFVLLWIVCGVQGQAQLVWTDPFFPTVDDDITLYFNAAEGNEALKGFTGDVYAHAGLITSTSSSPADWKFVVTPWAVTDAKVLMTRVDTDLYTLQYNIRDYYGVPMGEEVLQLAFVFRNANGSVVGRSADGSDIFTPVYPSTNELQTRLLAPTSDQIVSIGQFINVFAVASRSASLELYDNGNLVASADSNQLRHTLIAGPGVHNIEFVATDGGEESRSTFTYIVPIDLPNQDPPPSELGINYLADTTVLLRLYAPNKSNVFVVGDFNDWILQDRFQMIQSEDRNTFWLRIDGLTPGERYCFQYLVDGELRIADPYSTLVLDPSNDPFISPMVYPDMPPYPIGKTTGICSVIEPGKAEFDWQVDNFERPENGDLVVYELLIRDFLESRSYNDLLDTLDYLERLGVNAIELMPINEFEGNDSWGYNPSYHMALDKYYGTEEDFKTFIDEAHRRGIAVIVDVVYNHAFSQSPLAQLYWDSENFRPAADNPWLNVEARHPFNVGYDFDHSTQATRDFVDRVMKHWLTDYRVDGFRFDLSKGFTQVNSGNNVGQWGNYDGSRVAILKRYADVVWDTSPDAYVILEHFATNSEEKELADYGMMLWGNMTHEYQEGAMGYDSRLSFGYYATRGWNDPHLITYMESHDEERMVYKNLEFGNSAGDYNVRNMQTALLRTELASAFFYTVPGAKMLWEFGEVGYDFSINWCTDGTINNDCRLVPKPVRWDYYDDPDRRRLYDVTRGLIQLKLNYEAFRSTDVDLAINDANQSTGETKSIHINHSTMDVAVLGNFAVTIQSMDPEFQSTGTWYDYFSGDSLEVTDVNAPITLEAGEYRIYTSNRLPEPPGGYLDFVTSTQEILAQQLQWQVAPNPSTGTTLVNYQLKESAQVRVQLFNMLGQPLRTLVQARQAAGPQQLEVNNLAAGTYLLQIDVDGQSATERLIVL